MQDLSINVEISHSERVLDSILQNKGRKIEEGLACMRKENLLY